MFENLTRYDERYDFPNFSPRLEDYFNDFVDDPSRPEYSFSIDARYRLVAEHGYGVFWIICDALIFKNWEWTPKTPYYNKIEAWIQYLWNLLSKWKVKLKIREWFENPIYYTQPTAHQEFMKDAQLLLDKKTKEWLDNAKKNILDPFSWLFNMLHHEIYIALPDGKFWDETEQKNI